MPVKKTTAKPVEVKPVDPIEYEASARFQDADGDRISVDVEENGNLSLNGIQLARPLARALAGLLLRYADGGTIRA